MTQDEIIEMAKEAGIEDSDEYNHLVCTEVELVAFAKLVAAKAIQPKQEPVAWMDEHGKTFPFVFNVSSVQQGSKYLDETLTPLYTHPPQRTWVGLTAEDWYEFAKANLSWEELLIAAETKIKERNT